MKYEMDRFHCASLERGGIYRDVGIDRFFFPHWNGGIITIYYRFTRLFTRLVDRCFFIKIPGLYIIIINFDFEGKRDSNFFFYNFLCIVRIYFIPSIHQSFASTQARNSQKKEEEGKGERNKSHALRSRSTKARARHARHIKLRRFPGKGKRFHESRRV